MESPARNGEKNKMEETQQIQEPKFRVNFKQSAKGRWTAEFTVRADDLDQLHKDIGKCKTMVIIELEYMNGEGDEPAHRPI